MPRKGHSEEEILVALREIEAGEKAADVCRRQVVEAYTSLPYGGCLNQVGTVSALHFTGKQFDGETSLTYFPARFQSGYTGRFMTPDPLGGHAGNPQTLDKYVYVADDPVSLTDPTGLDFYLTCQKASSTCQKDKDGNFVQGQNVNGKFQATQLTEQEGGTYADQYGNTYTGSFNDHGVSFAESGGATSGGVFGRGTATDTLAGSGLFKGFTGTFNDNCGGTCAASGRLSGTAAQFKNLFSQMKRNPGLDAFDFFHFGATNYRNGNGSGLDPHVVDRESTRLGLGWDQLHFDGSYPYGNVGGLLRHTSSALSSILHLLIGPHELPPDATIPH